MQHFESILFFSRFHARHDLRRRDGGRGRPAALHSGQPADGRARRTQPLPLHVSDTCSGATAVLIPYFSL